MATKTLTITEDAYNLLAQNKLENESFSKTLKRILGPKKKKSLMDFFGIIPKEMGEAMQKDLKMIKEREIERLNREYNESS